MQPLNEFDESLNKLRESDNAKRLTIRLLKASVEKWKEESIGALAPEVDRYHGAIMHTRSVIELLEQNLASFELQTQSYA